MTTKRNAILRGLQIFTLVSLVFVFLFQFILDSSFDIKTIFASETLATNEAPVTVSQKSFQPSAPYYGTYFYMWHMNPTVDGRWNYWTDGGNTPPNSWFSKYIPDPNPNEFSPQTELYSSHDYKIFKWQVAKMKEARLEVAIASWWGDGGTDQAFDMIINDWMGRADNPYPNLRWAIYYERDSFLDEDVPTLVSRLQYIKDKYADKDYYLKVDGKPVIFVYGGPQAGQGNITQRWYQANQQMNNEFYISQQVFSGYSSDPYQPSSWHQYGPTLRFETQYNYSGYISPGFWLDNPEKTETLPRDPAAFEQAAQTLVNADVTWKMVQTWNEWGEGTAIEPGQRVRSVNGVDVIDENAPPFGNTYIDILKKTFPPLEKPINTYTVTSVRDTNIREDLPNQNFGENTKLQSQGTPMKTTYLKFNLKSLENKTFDKAKLSLYINNASEDVQKVYIVNQNSWAETDLNYNNNHLTLGNKIGSFRARNDSSRITVPITSDIQARFGGNLTIAIVSTGSDRLDFNSRESSNPPKLIIDAK